MFTGHKRQVSIVVATGIMLFANLVIGSGSFTESGSEQLVYYAYPTSFTPAPFTFAIWLPIFLGSIALAVFQALPGNRHNVTLDRIATPYLLALAANTAQVFTPLGWSNVTVLVLFVSLAFTFRQLVKLGSSGTGMTWCVQIPVALFATWAGLATILNACQWVVSVGGQIDGRTAAVLVTLAMTIGAYVVWRTRAFAVLAVMLWAGFGIYAANRSDDLLTLTILLTTLVSIGAAILASRRRGRPA